MPPPNQLAWKGHGHMVTKHGEYKDSDNTSNKASTNSGAAYEDHDNQVDIIRDKRKVCPHI
ncbi:hypothetical protein VTO73DRAFT_7133 [Trametes versicolor]